MNSVHVRASLLVGLVAVATATASSRADAPPARRPGLWEVRQGPPAMPNAPAVRICISPDEAKGDFRPQRSGAVGASSCDYQRLSATASEVRWRNVCTRDGRTTTMEGHAYDIKPDSFKQDVQMSGPMGKGTLHADAHWVSADCPQAH